MSEHRGHAYTVDRQPGCKTLRGGICLRTIRVPGLGIEQGHVGTLQGARTSAECLIDRHIREHGDAPVHREPMTDEERAHLYRETFGGF